MRASRNVVACAVVIALSSTRAFAGDSGVTTVNTVNVNTTWKGLLVQLANAATFEPQCPNSWAYMSVDDPLFKSTVAALMTAKASGAQVRIGTKGCVQAPLGIVPQIDWVDYGVRFGG